jgi:hypothetical protein
LRRVGRVRKERGVKVEGVSRGEKAVWGLERRGGEWGEEKKSVGRGRKGGKVVGGGR